MSLAIVHFAVGFGSTTLLWTVLQKDNTDHMLPVLLGGAIWAMMPDLHNVMPFLQEPYYQYLHDSPIAYIFWLHRGFDIADPQDTLTVAALAMMYICVCVAIREIYIIQLDS